jgi:PAS domain-containing protein
MMTPEQHESDEILRKLQERVKELNTLYRISKIMAMRDEPLEKSLKRIADILPQGWQHPDVCCSRITYGSMVATSPRFKEGQWKQVEEIMIDDNPVGSVEIHYVSKRPEADEGPFLLEERNLIIEISWRIAELITIRKNEMQQRAQERYVNFLNDAEELVAVVCAASKREVGVIRLANAPLCETLKYKPEELVGMRMSSIAERDSYTAFKEELKASEGCTCTSKRLVLIGSDGSHTQLTADAHRMRLSGMEHIFLVMNKAE